ncbi:hypothetical protein NESM_000759600 [Novymonas esmeraldas]|uniref:Uncharacterized protein n=1 Tax=Novymonas esmeraldas TaxID=1808958 RepID=A0AAW0EUW1_9TRYP
MADVLTAPSPATSPPADHHTSPSSDAAGSAAAAVPDAAADAELRRRIDLGVLLVNMGAATEERVFGMQDSAAMHAYRERRVRELLVVNRRQDDAAAHPLVWFKPWTWWRSGPQVSPMQWGVYPHPAGSTGGSDAATSTAATPPSPPADGGVEAPAPTAPPARRRRKGLPAVDTRALTSDEVSALTAAVRDERAALLRGEEDIHAALHGVEDRRYRYLVPSRDVKCEKQVVEVLRCYTEHTATEGVVRGDLLACGPHVSRLRTCAEAMVAQYSSAGESV